MAPTAHSDVSTTSSVGTFRLYWAKTSALVLVILTFWNAASCTSFHWKVALDLLSSLNGWVMVL